ncbi:MAG: TerB family tellurite resistance protein [Myxococcota bacterium]
MSLSLKTQWTIVASGLVAHADHVLTGEECERLMAMVDAQVDEDEYAQWMAIISDGPQLEQRLKSLPPPPAEDHRQILEDAWLMAVVDGERADEEIEALERIAEHIGVEPLQLEFWREAWTEAQQAYAEHVSIALAWVLGGGEPAGPDDAGTIRDTVGELPTTHEHREQLEGVARAGHDGDKAAAGLRAAGTAQRRDALQRLHAAAEAASRGDEAKTRWRELAAATGLDDAEIERIASA